MQHDLVVFDIDDVDVEANFFEEAAILRHQQDTGVTLGLDQSVPPRLAALFAGLCCRRACREPSERQNQHDK
jgi:hypothetical protein